MKIFVDSINYIVYISRTEVDPMGLINIMNMLRMLPNYTKIKFGQIPSREKFYSEEDYARIVKDFLSDPGSTLSPKVEVKTERVSIKGNEPEPEPNEDWDFSEDDFDDDFN